jgi:long-chain acyl-CoA synthetase
VWEIFANATPRLTVTDLAPIEAAASDELDFEASWRAVERDDVATLIYTSGTTGPPKGVELTHANLLAAWESSVAAVPAIGRRGRYVSYLPTAHLADRVFAHYPAFATGSCITCIDDVRAAVLHLPAIRPTLFLAVPRIWEKLKDAIAAGLLEADSLGLGAADLVVSGSAPIRPDVLEFFAARGIEICEGYGMTESSAIATLNRPGDVAVGTVGTPLPGVELALADDGEVLLRGAVVMSGYRGEPGKTAEALDADGWLHTGDVGALDPDGRLRIVDRKKELIINAAGKNMSPANIEAAIKSQSPLIAHAVAIGDRRPYNVALLVLDPDVPTAGTDVQATVADAVARANALLSRVEQIKRFTIVDDDWAAGGDLVTPTMKLRRKPIAERYAETIEEMYT